MYKPCKDMKTISFCSIYKESSAIISSNTKLFTQIAIFLILPSSIISLISKPLSTFLFPDISVDQLTTTNPPPAISPWTIAAFLVFQLAYSVFSIGLSLLSFSSVTYSVACIYTGRTDVTFKTTLCAFKKVWKKLVLTWLAKWVVIFGYALLAGLTIMVPVMALSSGSGRYQTLGFLAVVVITMVFVGGIVYITIIWTFGTTVAVLETTYGFKALSKSKSLIKGKAYQTYKVLFPISACSGSVAWIFLKVVVNGGLIGLGLVIRIGSGVACLPVMVGLMVFAEVALTVTYLVCKADKGESITKSNVMDHLDIFVDGYAPLGKANDEQI